MKLKIKTLNRKSHPLVIPMSIAVIVFASWKVVDELQEIHSISLFWIENPLGLQPWILDPFWIQLLPACFFTVVVLGALLLLIHAFRNHDQWEETENSYSNVVSYQVEE